MNSELIEKDQIWLTWERQRRNESMSRALRIPLFELRSERPRLLRYLDLGFKTVSIIYKKRPQNVFAQNPSIVLSVLVILLRPIFGYRAFIDQHNSGLYPLEGRSRILNLIARWIVRRADAVIVTNSALATQCSKWGGYAVVMPDPIPHLGCEQHSTVQPRRHGTPFRVICICTWADDEPIEEILGAAEHLNPEKVVIEITGRPWKKLKCNNLPDTVQLLGFISDEEYLRKLCEADGVLVLTERDDCLNCGAYEAVAIGIPGILSKRDVIMSYFNKGFVYTNNSRMDIVDSVIKLIEEYSCLSGQIDLLKNEIQARESQYIDNINTELLTNRNTK